MLFPLSAVISIYVFSSKYPKNFLILGGDYIT